MMSEWTVEKFEAQRSTHCRWHIASHDERRLELIEVNRLPLRSGRMPSERIPSERRAPFSLVFRDGQQGVMPQSIYRLEHDVLGMFEIFLVPIGPDEQGMRYEAVFH